MELRKFQQEFIQRAFAPGIDIAALSLPRGNGKSFLAAHVVTRSLTPGDELFVNGQEIIQCAGSIEQARIVYNFVRAALEPTGEYRFIDSVTRLGITHRATNSKLRIISSNGKTAMGIVSTKIAIADEPGSWEIGGGALMWDALTGALGKPGSPLRIIIIGTLAPAAQASGHWWYDLVKAGSKGSTFVMSLQGDAATWDSWATIKRANPLTAISPEFRKKLLEERDAARADSRLKARFLSYRLNIPSADESQVLLTTADWDLIEGRAVPEPQGSPTVGVDLGGGRAWSAAVAVWPSGRTECLAVAPGLPDLEAQEKRDRVPPQTYQRLYDRGQLDISEGLRVPPVLQVWQAIRERWGKPKVLVCDRFRLPELQDVIRGGVRLEPRVTRWSESAFDIRALRRMAKDGPLSIDRDSRLLLETSLARARVVNDDSGNVRLIKYGTNNESRDDVCAAWVLAAGAMDRHPARSGSGYLGMTGE